MPAMEGRGTRAAANGRVACGAGSVYLLLGKCWWMSLIDILEAGCWMSREVDIGPP